MPGPFHSGTGLTWAIRPVAAGSPGESHPSVGIADDGTVYLSWNGADNHAFTSVSRDKGLTWSTPYDVGTQLGIQNVAFPAAVAGDSGRAAVAFLGTTTGGNSQETDVFKGVWQLYVASTFDGGKTWKTSNATGADPVQRGSICTLAPLASQRVDISWTSAKKGTHVVTAVVDPTNAIAESREDNNKSTATVTVK